MVIGMNQSEELAKALMEAILPGTEMRDRTEEAGGTHDFDLYREGHLVAAVEVTASKDATIEQTLAAINDERKGGQSVPARRCKMSWWVHCLPSPNINRLRAKLDDYLAEVEAEGVGDFGDFLSWIDAADSPAAARLFCDLGVKYVQLVNRNPPGQISIVPSGGGGRVDPMDVQRVVEAEARKDDNRRKLRRSGLDDRHLFVYVEQTHYLPWKALVSEQPPESAPALPDEITRVWAATASYPGEFVVWSAERGQRWEDARLVTLSPDVFAEILSRRSRRRPKTGCA